MTKKEEREARKLEKLRLEKERMYEMFSFEREYGDVNDWETMMYLYHAAL